MIEKIRLAGIMGQTLVTVGRLLPHTLSPGFKPGLRPIKENWSKNLSRLAGLKVSAVGAPIRQEPTLFVGNHTGYMDIVVLVGLLWQSSFISKKEVRAMPLFGRGAEAIGTLFVDRDSLQSRKKIAEQIATVIRDDKRSLTLFPEGTSRTLGTKWRSRAFEIAAEAGLTVQPFRLGYRPHIKAVDDLDAFYPHILNLLSEGEVECEVEFAEPRLITNAAEETKAMQAWVEESLKTYLQKTGQWNEALRHHEQKELLRAEKRAARKVTA